MTTSTTGIRTPPESKSIPGGSGHSEPDSISRERTILRQVLALVAERAEVEASVHGARTSGDHQGR